MLIRPVAHDHLVAFDRYAAVQHLAETSFLKAPAIPEDELLQYRRIKSRLAVLSEQGLDVDAMQSEQFVGAALTSRQRNKIVVSRCEYDVEISDALLVKFKKNLRPDFKWLVTNLTAKDPMCESLPLGLNDFCNYSPFHLFAGDTRTIAFHRTYSTTRSGVLLCMNPRTSPAARHSAINAVSTHPAVQHLPLERSPAGFSRYLTALSKSMFCICPRGNGIDTHRFWESLYMGCIPVIKAEHLLACHADLPCLVLDDWTDLANVDLSGEWHRIRAQTYNFLPLTVSYWVEKVRQLAFG